MKQKHPQFPCEDLPFFFSSKVIQRLKAEFYAALYTEIQRQVALQQSSVSSRELHEFCKGFYCDITKVGDKQRLRVRTDWEYVSDITNDPSMDLKSRAKVLPLASVKEKKVIVLSVPRKFKRVWVHPKIANSSFVHRALKTALKKVFDQHGGEIVAKAFEQYAKEKK